MEEGDGEGIRDELVSVAMKLDLMIFMILETGK